MRITPDAAKKFLWACCLISSGLLAIGSKENAVMLPLFILLYEWYFFQDLSFRFTKYYYLVLAVFMFFIIGATFYYLGPTPLESIIESYESRVFTLQERLYTQLRVIVLYISMVFFPHPSRLTLEHDFLLSHSIVSPASTLLCLVFLVLVACISALNAKRERLISFCIFWFLGNLVIESSIIPLEIIFEHRTYLPSMLLIFLGVVIVHRSVRQMHSKIILLFLVVALFSSWTYARNSVWQNDLALWTDIARKAPNKSRAQMNLGIFLSRENRMEEAMPYLEKAVRLDPDYGLAHYSLGDALMKQKKYIEASQSYARGLLLEPGNTLMRFNLAKSLAAMGKYKNALYHLQLVVNDPTINHQVFFHMGNSLYYLRRYDEALQAYNTAVRIKPDFSEALQAIYNTTKKIIESNKTP